MDTEFINEYISKLTSLVHELINKNVMLEAKLSLAEKASSKLQQEVDKLTAATDKASTTKK